MRVDRTRDDFTWQLEILTVPILEGHRSESCPRALYGYGVLADEVGFAKHVYIVGNEPVKNTSMKMYACSGGSAHVAHKACILSILTWVRPDQDWLSWSWRPHPRRDWTHCLWLSLSWTWPSHTRSQRSQLQRKETPSRDQISWNSRSCSQQEQNGCMVRIEYSQLSHMYISCPASMLSLGLTHWAWTECEYHKLTFPVTLKATTPSA